MIRRNLLLAGLATLVGAVIGVSVGTLHGSLVQRALPFLKQRPAPDEPPFRWPDGFMSVEIPSSADGTMQKAMFHAAPAGERRPLIVNLHVWSGDFASRDPLAALAAEAGWNYVHPDFRGPNRGPDNCLSEKVVADLDDAIAYSLRSGNVDPERVFVVGFSGGGYVALGMYLRTRWPVRAFLTWAPITDLAAWYDESAARGNAEFTDQIRRCTSSGEFFDRDAARRRSPLYWDLPATPRSRVELYAGINDGYSGTVPISHSIRFYNRLAQAYGDPTRMIGADEIAALLSRGVPPGQDEARISDRALLFQRGTAQATFTVFRGGHEMLSAFCFERLKALARAEGDRDGGNPGR